MYKNPIITLLSDFGLVDSYVAEMKAVILSINPSATLIDISHNIKPYNIRMGAYILARIVEYFPEKTIHLAVVDPGVGGPRKPIIVETLKALFVGPDNGLLMLAAEKLGVNHVYQIENKQYMLKEISKTFHGRDIFAPAAAYLSLGVPPKNFGKEVFDYVKPSYIKPKIFKNKIVGEIIHLDNFGNIITNITQKHLKTKNITYGKSFQIILGENKPLKVRFLESYFQALNGEIFALVGSGNFVEISENLGNAAKTLNVKTGTKITFIF